MPAARWRIVVQRSRADWLTVAAAWLVILAAATLLSAGVMYAEAVSRGGLLRALREAPPNDVNLEVTARVVRDEVEAAAASIPRELDRTFAGVGITVHHSARSGSFALPDQAGEGVDDLAIFTFFADIADHASLLSGHWPTPGRDPLEVAVSEPAARELGVTVGDTRRMRSRVADGPVVEVLVSGVYRVEDAQDPFWRDDVLELQGVVERGDFATFGPLVVERSDLLDRVVSQRVELTWRVAPALEDIGPTTVSTLHDRLPGLADRLRSDLVRSPYIQVETDLAAVLGRVNSSLLVSGTGVLLLNIQLAVLGGYALVLVAGLIVEHRRAESALIRSRGGSGVQMAGLAFLEGLLIVLPAALAGPPLAVALLAVVERAGPLAGSGVALQPRITDAVVLVAAGVAISSIAGLVVSAFTFSGPLAAIRRSIGRPLERTAPQRLGLDIAVLVLAVVGLWQLRLYGAPITRSLRGSLGADPLLVAAPALGLLAGALLALRFIPLAGRLLEELLARRRGLVSALGARQLSRRPLRYTRAALLLMVASAIGFFAGAYSGTWTRSQQDQVDYEVGADVRAVSGPSSAGSGGSASANLAALRALPAVGAAMPVLREDFDLGRTGGRGSLLALSPRQADAIVVFRPDLSDRPFAELMRGLEEAPTTPGAVSLPSGTARLALDVHAAVRPVGDEVDTAQIPAGWAGLSTAVVVRQGDGLIERLSAPPGTFGSGVQRLVVPVPGATSGMEDELAALELLAVEIEPILPTDVAVAGTIELVAIATNDQIEGNDWVPIDVDPAGEGWAPTVSPDFADPRTLPAEERRPLGLSIPDDRPLIGGERIRYGLRPAALLPEVEREPLPALVDDRFLAVTGTTIGHRIEVAERFAAARDLRIIGRVAGVPTLAPDEPAVVVGGPALALAEFVTGGRTLDYGEWWLSAESDPAALARAMREGPIGAQEVLVRTEEANARLSDPIALGVAGALLLGAAAAAVFAVIGFVVSAAIGARERIGEFALLRALGLSPRQLSTWLSLESTFLLILSLAAGVGLGVILAWVVMPSATLRQDGTPVMPPVEVTMPWPVVAWLGVLGGVALLATALVMSRVLRRAGLGTLLRSVDD